jgi:hypothetical protein
MRLVAACFAALLAAGSLHAQQVITPAAPSIATPVSVANGGTGTGTAGDAALNNILGYTHITAGKSPAFSNSITIAGTDSTTMTFPGASDTVVGLAATQSLTNKTVNGLTLTANATGFQIAGGTTSKTAAFSNSLTFAGTDATTMTFPSTSQTIMALGIAQNLGNSGAIATANSGSSYLNIQGAGGFDANSIAVGHGTATASCTVPSGASGSPICTVTHTAGSFAQTLTFSGGTVAFTGTTMTVTQGTAAPSTGYLCSGRDVADNLNVITTAFTSTTISTLTFENLAGTPTAPALTAVVYLTCTAE